MSQTSHEQNPEIGEEAIAAAKAEELAQRAIELIIIQAELATLVAEGKIVALDDIFNW